VSKKKIKRRIKDLETELDTLRARIVALEGVNTPKAEPRDWGRDGPLNNDAVAQMATGVLADMLKSPWWTKK